MRNLSNGQLHAVAISRLADAVSVQVIHTHRNYSPVFKAQVGLVLSAATLSADFSKQQEKQQGDSRDEIIKWELQSNLCVFFLHLFKTALPLPAQLGSPLV